MKKKWMKYVGLGLCMLSLAACGNKDETSASGETKNAAGKTEIAFTWWGSEVRHEKYIEAIEAFEKANPDIKVDYEYGSWDDYWKKLATKSAAGDLPDVIQMDLQYIAQYGEKSQLADMTEFIGDTIKTDDIKDSIVDTGKLNDKIYGVPASVNSMSMLVNPELAEKSGATLDYDNYTFQDFVKNAQAIYDATGSYGWNDNNDNSTIMQYFLRTKGEDLFKYNDDGKPEVGFTEANFEEFMQAIADLTKAGAMPTAEITSNAKSFDEYPFSMGEAGYMQTWSNQFITYQESAAEGVKFDLVKPYDANDGALSYRPGFFYSITETSKNKEAAAKLVDFMINSEEANTIIGTERGIPANDAIKEQLYDSMTDNEKATSDFLDDMADTAGDPSPIPPIGFAEMNTTFKEVYAEITYGTMTPKEAYTTFKDKCEEIIGENYE